jgi:hypothetical protein
VGGGRSFGKPEAPNRKTRFEVYSFDSVPSADVGGVGITLGSGRSGKARYGCEMSGMEAEPESDEGMFAGDNTV